MESKNQNMAFLSDDNWWNDVALLTDITQHLTEPKLKLKGKRHLVNKLLEHICAFEKKVRLLQVQFGSATMTHYTCLAARKNGIS